MNRDILVWKNGQEHLFARRVTFFSFYQSEHKNFHANGLYAGKGFFLPEQY